MHLPWFVSHIDEEYVPGSNMPVETRKYWLTKLRHFKVKYVFAGNSSSNNSIASFPKDVNIVKNNSTTTTTTTTTTINEDAVDASIEIDDIEVLNVDSSGVFDSDDVNIDSKEPLKPSQIIRNALKSGEIKEKDSKVTNDNEEVIKEGDNNDDDSESSDDDDNVNEDEDYDGPYIITTTSISTSISNNGINSDSNNDLKGIRIIDVDEYEISHKFHHLDQIPTTLTFKEPIIKPK
jgi:hypothetical protein